MSVEFYNLNGKNFFETTKNADMSKAYEVFESFLNTKGKILDLGCGSGRDSLYFLKKGYEVTPTDFSPTMVSLASELLKKDVIKLDMREMDYKEEFDGIWACASILHIEKKEIPKVLLNSWKALKENGIMYMSFKYGVGERITPDRHFSNYTEESFSELLESIGCFKLKRFWKTSDVRKGREDEFWLNIIVEK